VQESKMLGLITLSNFASTLTVGTIQYLCRKRSYCDLSDNRVLMMMIVERVYCSVCGAVS
jgi:hypothetical protein